MKKINQKGVTSIELLVCFIIVSVVVVGMFNMIMNYKNKEQIEAISNEVTTYSNNLQKVMNDDLIKGHLVSVDYISSDSKSASFTFDNPSSYTTNLSINVDDGTISYGISSDVIDYEIPAIADLVLGSESRIDYINNYLKITIVLHHPNFIDETTSFVISCPVNYVY